MRKMLYIYPTAFEDVRTDPITRFLQAWDCWKTHGDTGAAWFFLKLGWDRMWNVGYYAPGGPMDTLFKGWRDCAICELDHTSKP